MRKYVAVGSLAVLFTANLLILAPSSFGLAQSGVLRQLDLVVDVRDELVKGYVEETDGEELVRAAVRGMVRSLGDQHTAYLAPEDLERFDRETSGSFSGIGAEVTIDEAADRLKIVSPIEDTPAWRAGVMAGDIVMTIDGEDTLGMKLGKAVEKLIGEAGTDVTIVVEHDSGDREEITITRARISVSTIRGVRRAPAGGWDFMIDPEHKIGYVRVRQFSGTTAEDLQAVVEDLKADGMRGLIVDLRFNPGGLLQSAVGVANLFLDPQQAVVSVKGRKVDEYVHRSTDPQIAAGIEMVVLANGASASAAEIVTGALADHGRARFVGTRTFGKGSVQQLRELPQNQGALKITSAYWFTPNGAQIHRVVKDEVDEDASEVARWGVDPEDGFWVPMSAEQVREMFDIRRKSDILRNHEGDNGGDQDTGPDPGPLTPERIRAEMADLQLAAGLEAMLGKLETGDWPVVGESGAELLVKQGQISDLKRRRQSLKEMLATTEEKLAKLESGVEVSAVNEPAAPTPEEPVSVAPLGPTIGDPVTPTRKKPDAGVSDSEEHVDPSIDQP